MSKKVFNFYSRFYDMLNSNKDYVAEVDYIVSLLEKFCLKGKNLLEFGSGTGKHGNLLAKKGYSVIGVEKSSEMISQAIQSERFQTKIGDISSINLDRNFDAVLSLFHVMSYQSSNKTLLATFLNAYNHMTSGGLFIFDVWYSPAVYKQRPVVRVKYFNDEAFNLTRIAEPVIYNDKNIVDVNYRIIAENLENGELHTVSETHRMRHFSLPELDLLAEFTGFERIKTEEFLTGNPPSDNTWGVCSVFKKI